MLSRRGSVSRGSPARTSSWAPSSSSTPPKTRSRSSPSTRKTTSTRKSESPKESSELESSAVSETRYSSGSSTLQPPTSSSRTRSSCSTPGKRPKPSTKIQRLSFSRATTTRRAARRTKGPTWFNHPKASPFTSTKLKIRSSIST